MSPEQIGLGSQEQTVVAVSIEDEEKTEIGSISGKEYKVIWQESDAIKINGTASSSISVDPDNKTRANFTFDGLLDFPYHAVYPASKASEFKADTACVTLPSTQKYIEGQYDPEAAVLLAYSESGALSFKHAVAYLRLTIADGFDSDNLKSVTIKGGQNEALSGQFKAVISDKELSLANNSTDGSSVTMDFGEGIKQGTPIFIVIPARTYEKGLILSVTDVQGHSQDITSKTNLTAVAGKIYGTKAYYDGDGGGYTSLAQLAATATSSTKKSFSCKIKCTVTYTYNNYAYIQDRSGAISVYVYNHGLKEGDTFDGTVSGKISLYNSLPQISTFTTSSATKGTTTDIPETHITVAELTANYSKYYSCRVVLQDVNVTEGVNSSNDTGTIEQNGSTETIFSKNKSKVTIETGATGTLTAFPSTYKGTNELMIFEQWQFEEKVLPAEETKFTKTEAIGVYTLANAGESVTPILSLNATSEISLGQASSQSNYSILQPVEGCMLDVQLGSKTVSTGKSYSATVTNWGFPGISAYSGSLLCVKVSGNKVWLRNTEHTIGYILGIE